MSLAVVTLKKGEGRTLKAGGACTLRPVNGLIFCIEL